MNYQRLPPEYGTPLRFCIENQIGYKIVKWIRKTEFLAARKNIGKSYSGKNKDDKNFDLLADI